MNILMSCGLLLLILVLNTNLAQSHPGSQLKYFPDDYLDARTRFRNYSTQLTAENKKNKAGSIEVQSKIDNDLTIDYLYLPAEVEAEYLLILTSGIHGVEAFAGSAIQSMFLEEYLSSINQSNTGILLVHSLNPYGYKYLRRVSENNVDLNRNFDTSSDLFASPNEGYKKVDQMLNPTSKVNLSSFSYYFSFIEMIYNIWKYSMKTLRQAVLQGQYENDTGLYFGGKTFEPHKQKLEELFLSIGVSYKKIFAVDLHTGYGEKGKLHLFGNAKDSRANESAQQKVFSGFQVDTGNDEDFYSINGDFTTYLGKIFSHTENFVTMTFEYGTLDSQTTFGALKSIDNMIRENQGFHFGYESDQDELKIKNRIQEMYYPMDQKWRKQILDQTRKTLPALIRKFSEL